MIGRYDVQTWEPREPGPRRFYVVDRVARAVVRESVDAPWGGAYLFAGLAASRLNRGVARPDSIVEVRACSPKRSW